MIKLVMVPFLTNSLIRTYGWIVLLRKNGIINTALISLNITDGPLSLMYNDLGIIIGKRGDTLDSLEHLTNLCVNKGDVEYVKVVLDVENYRARREQTLIKLAKNLASTVVRTGKKITLEPMHSNERRIIHATLQSNDNVETYSVGEEPNRKVVIAIKKK